MNKYTEADIRKIVENVAAQIAAFPQHSTAPAPEPSSANALIPVEASARHVHLTREAVETLFGKGAKLTIKNYLSQPGEFLSEQRVMIVTNKGMLSNVAVLGPERSKIQVELSLTDGRVLGIRLPVNISGDLNGAADVLMVGPCGIWEAKGSAIAAKAHVHMTPKDAASYGVKDGQTVSVSVGNGRSVTFSNVVIRVSSKYALAAHIDIDEANACGLGKDSRGMIITEPECPPHHLRIFNPQG